MRITIKVSKEIMKQKKGRIEWNNKAKLIIWKE